MAERRGRQPRTAVEDVPDEPRGAIVNSTADRALDILMAFSDDQRLWSASELADKFKMPRSTLYRYLNSLRGYNLIAEDQNGRFRLGARVLQLARIARESTSILQVALPRMHKLQEDFGEIVVLKERVGYDTVNLERLEGRHRITLTATRSQILPWPAAPSAKVFTAFADAAERKELLGFMKPVAYTPRTVPNMKALMKQLETIRELGYSIVDEEMDEGVRGVGVPIFQDGQCRYTLSLPAPSFRMSDARMIEAAVAFKREAEAITAELEALTRR